MDLVEGGIELGLDGGDGGVDGATLLPHAERTRGNRVEADVGLRRHVEQHGLVGHASGRHRVWNPKSGCAVHVPPSIDECAEGSVPPMSQSELTEHASYVADEVKVEAYRRALTNLVKPGDVVIDLGCGSGLLGLLALEAGAGCVIAVDSGPILEVARDTFAANGVIDRVRFHRGDSSTLGLSEPADVVVCDQIGGFAHEVGLTKVVRDLFDRGVAKPDAIVVPGGFELFVAPVALTAGDPLTPWSDNSTGFDFSPFGRSAANTPFRLTVDASSLLGPGVMAWELDATDTSAISFELDLPIARGGRFTGLVGYMRAHLDRHNGVVLTNDPNDPGRFRRWHLYHPLATPIDVAAGERVHASFVINQLGQITKWTVEVADHRQSMSSFIGDFIDPLVMFDPPAERLLTLNRPGLARRTALDAIGDGVLFPELVERLAVEFPDQFPTPDEARRFVRDLIGRYCEPGQDAVSSPDGRKGSSG